MPSEKERARNAAVKEDGRAARSKRSKLAIAGAMLELIAAGNSEPSAREVANQAGVSPRLVFHHFKDMESIYGEMLLMQMERLGRLLSLDEPNGEPPLEDRIAEFISHRCALLEFITPSRKAITGKGIEKKEEVAKGLALWREHEKRQIEKLFERELSSFGDKAERTTKAIQAATSWQVWHALCDYLGLRPEEAEEVMAQTVWAVLTCKSYYQRPQ